MKEELTQAELDEIFYGRRPVVVAKFYLHSVLDPDKSREAGHRVESQHEYVHLSCEKEDTEIRRPATNLDRKNYRREYDAFVQQNEAEKNEPRHRQVQDLRAEGAPEGAHKAAGNW